MPTATPPPPLLRADSSRIFRRPPPRLARSRSQGDVPLHLKVAAGLTTGAIGISVASPTDLVKVRLQAEGKLPAGAVKKYPSATAAYGIIVKQEGFLALWTGITPNIMRNSVINAAELASYDQVKSSLMATGMEDGVPLHLLSGLGAGFVACCVGSPVDVVKSRVMGDSAGAYKGFLDCVSKTLANEGPMAFYKVRRQVFMSTFFSSGVADVGFCGVVSTAA